MVVLVVEGRELEIFNWGVGDDGGGLCLGGGYGGECECEGKDVGGGWGVVVEVGYGMKVRLWVVKICL